MSMGFLTSKLRNNNWDTAKAVEYYGAIETYYGLLAYNKDLGMARKFEIQNSIEENRWEDENTFIVLINTITSEVCGLRDFGKHYPEYTDFMLRTDFLPVKLYDMPKDYKELEDIAKKTLSLFLSEKNAAIEKYEYPVMLLRYAGGDFHAGFSILENIELVISGFNKSKTNFKWCVNGDITKFTAIPPLEANTKYEIITPSEELIRSCGMSLFPDKWDDVEE